MSLYVNDKPLFSLYYCFDRISIAAEYIFYYFFFIL